ncbi:MAG: hypothetical protein DRO36_06075 [Candidatus Hecatellales archaeon]|nr:MAG: hypothetical protein DRO36_06075 [Candidatus Hecatellales archaeon]
MSEVIGVVLASEFPDKVYIVCNKNSQILLGDILRVEDRLTGKRYLVRVTSAKQPGEEDLAKIARRMLRDKNAENLASLAPPEVVYIASLLCTFREDGKPYIPKDLPSLLSRVYLPDREDLAFIEKLKEREYDREIGVIRVRSSYKLRVAIKGEDIPRHLGVYAITGKGKTNFVKVLLYALATAPRGKYSALVFDAHDEYYKNVQAGLLGLQELGIETIKYYDLHAENSPKIPLSDLRPSDLDVVFRGLPEAQYEAAVLLYYKYRSFWIRRLLELEQGELKSFCKEELEDLVRVNTLSALIRKVKLLASRPAFSVKEEGNLVAEVLDEIDRGCICIVNTRNLDEIEERAVLSILTGRLVNARKDLLDKNPEELLNKPIVLVVLEEALSVLGAKVLKKGSNIFADLTREGRKYRIGLLVVAQLPQRLDPDVAGNINTNVIMGLAQERSRRAVVENAMDDLDSLLGEIRMLDVGEAIVSYPNKSEVPFPLPVKIHHFNELVREFKAKNVKTIKVGAVDKALME